MTRITTDGSGMFNEVGEMREREILGGRSVVYRFMAFFPPVTILNFEKSFGVLSGDILVPSRAYNPSRCCKIVLRQTNCKFSQKTLGLSNTTTATITVMPF